MYCLLMHTSSTSMSLAIIAMLQRCSGAKAGSGKRAREIALNDSDKDDDGQAAAAKDGDESDNEQIDIGDTQVGHLSHMTCSLWALLDKTLISCMISCLAKRDLSAGDDHKIGSVIPHHHCSLMAQRHEGISSPCCLHSH